MIEAFPLQWPLGFPRTKHQQPARFDTSFAGARDAIVDEIKRFGGRNVVISTDIPLRNDGLPYASYKIPKDCGVAVYFDFEKESVVFACDKWNRVEDNMQAIRKTIEAMRGLDRWGVSDMLKRAFTGFKALPEQPAGRKWWEVLGVEKDASPESIKTAYRVLLHHTHPDKGGTAERFLEVQKAYREATT